MVLPCPSLWYEVFGLVIIEAFAQHTPAIVRNMGAMPDLIAQSGGGLVYETETQLEKAMDRLLAEPEQRTALGRRGYDAVLREWSPQAHVARYLEGLADLQASCRPAEWSIAAASLATVAGMERSDVRDAVALARAEMERIGAWGCMRLIDDAMARGASSTVRAAVAGARAPSPDAEHAPA